MLVPCERECFVWERRETPVLGSCGRFIPETDSSVFITFADPYILPPLHQVGISNVGGLIPSLKYIFTRIRRYARLSIHS